MSPNRHCSPGFSVCSTYAESLISVISAAVSSKQSTKHKNANWIRDWSLKEGVSLGPFLADMAVRELSRWDEELPVILSLDTLKLNFIGASFPTLSPIPQSFWRCVIPTVGLLIFCWDHKHIMCSHLGSKGNHTWVYFMYVRRNLFKYAYEYLIFTLCVLVYHLRYRMVS